VVITRSFFPPPSVFFKSSRAESHRGFRFVCMVFGNVVSQKPYLYRFHM